jgi:hypothetical protein
MALQTMSPWHKILFFAATIATCFLAVSCKSPQPEAPTYGQAGPDTIRVYITGINTLNPGLYYFTNGASLCTALKISNNLEPHLYARRLEYTHWDVDHYQDTVYHNYLKVNVLDFENVILHDQDTIQFPSQIW